MRPCQGVEAAGHPSGQFSVAAKYTAQSSGKKSRLEFEVVKEVTRVKGRMCRQTSVGSAKTPTIV